MANIHFVLQGKGGVGKSLVASFISQYLLSTGHSLVGIDTDPVNSTFSQFKSLPVQRLDILKDGLINEPKFDQLMGLLLDEDEATEIVVDNGAASFIPVCNYLLKNQAIELLQAEGHRVFVHTVVTGGPAFLDTLSGFDSLVSQFPDSTQHTLWTNSFFGELEYNGTPFDAINVIRKHQDGLFGIIHIPKQDGLFAGSLKAMLENHQTFGDAATNTAFGFMDRHRLSIIRGKLFKEMEPVLGKRDHV